MATERLSGLDAVFLAVEDHNNPMNIGSVGVFDGPAPSLDELLAVVAARIDVVPRCRQRIHERLWKLVRPAWIDDTDFDLGRHIRRTSLVEPTSVAFDEQVATLISAPLDRQHPLWQLWIVDGLAEGRWALVAKVHHCMVDGVAGSELLSALLTADTAHHTSPSTRPAPTPVERRRWWRRARDIARAARDLWYRQQPAPTSLIGPIGQQRRWTHLSIPMGDVRSIRARFGGTVNDVVLTAVSVGFGDLLRDRGENIAGRAITAMVPVSLRATDDRGVLGNRVANVHARLPVGDDDVRRTLRTIHEHLDELKASHQTEATGLLMRCGDYLPRPLADLVARRVVGRQRNLETVVTNVPGPPVTLQVGTKRMVEAYPVAPIGGLVRITIAVWSHGEHLCLGITGDRDSVADIEVLRRGVARGFGRLLDLSS